MSICPVTREVIKSNDLFVYKSRSGKKIKYSASAIATYIDTTGKLQCPLTREKWGEATLYELQRCTRKKSKILRKYFATWSTITNSSMRSEIARAFDLLERQQNNYNVFAHLVAFLLVVKHRVSAATFRNMVKKMRARDAVLAARLVVFADSIDSFMFPDVVMSEDRFSVKFRVRDGIELVEPYATIKEEFPAFDICCCTSISQTLASH